MAHLHASENNSALLKLQWTWQGAIVQAHTTSHAVPYFYLGLLRFGVFSFGVGFFLPYEKLAVSTQAGSQEVSSHWYCSVSCREWITMVSQCFNTSLMSVIHWRIGEEGKVSFVLFIQPLFRKLMCIVTASGCGVDAFYIITYSASEGFSVILWWSFLGFGFSVFFFFFFSAAGLLSVLFMACN